MEQWFNDCLVAIDLLANGKFKVLELPPRSADVHTSRKSFKTEELAEAFIKDQYTDITRVEPVDIKEEIPWRRVQLGWPQEEEEQ